MFSNETTTRIQGFGELTTRELYGILKARAAVFVVEQDCPYQDLDDIDLKATHITTFIGSEIVAYARVFKDSNTDLWHIGRVLTTRRGQHYGAQMMKEAIDVAASLGAKTIEIEAQSYATGFYEKFGFRESSDEFVLDGILHKRMLLKLNEP